MEAGWRWRRDREWEQRALTTALLMLCVPGGGEKSLTGLYDDVRFSMPGYMPDEEPKG